MARKSSRRSFTKADKKKDRAKRAKRRRFARKYISTSNAPPDPKLMVPVVLPVEAWIQLISAAYAQVTCAVPPDLPEEEMQKHDYRTKLLKLSADAAALQLQEKVGGRERGDRHHRETEDDVRFDMLSLQEDDSGSTGGVPKGEQEDDAGPDPDEG